MIGNSEGEIVEEMAAALIDFLVESISGTSLDAANEAIVTLGLDDGDELQLPESFDDDAFAGELIAEAILARPELHDVLTAVGTLLVKRVKMG